MPGNVPVWAAYLDLKRRAVMQGKEYPTYAEINAYAELAGLDKLELVVKVHAIEDALHANTG